MTNTISCQNTVESSGLTCDESSRFKSETQAVPTKGKHGKCPPARSPNHTNYMWKNIDDVKYERFAPGKMIKIAGPGVNTKNPFEVPSEQLLKTKLLDKPGTDLLIGRICLHYVELGQCYRGAQCTYAHPVLTHPDAEYDARGKPRKGLLMKDNCNEVISLRKQQLEKKSLSPELKTPQQQNIHSKHSLFPISDHLSPPLPVPVPVTVSTVPLVMLQPLPMVAHPGNGGLVHPPSIPLPLPSVSMPIPMAPLQYPVNNTPPGF